jgi:3-hydroxyisobutyrate dehydrogenase
METQIKREQGNMAKKIGFIGTGLMGRGMARNLIRKGQQVKIYNRTRAKAELAEIGGTVAIEVKSSANPIAS